MRSRRARGPRRQWGADRRNQPIPAVPPRAGTRSLAFGRLAILLTVVAWSAYVTTVVRTQAGRTGDLTIRHAIETVSYLAIVTALTFSAVAYLVARQGYLRRTRRHHRVPRAEIDHFFDERRPSTTLLVPSYREDRRIIWQTLISAALQEAPDLRVVLLIDDPPNSSDPAAQEALRLARRAPVEIAELLRVPRKRMAEAYAVAQAECALGSVPTQRQLLDLAEHYEWAAGWLEELAASWQIVDHSDAFLTDHVIRRLGGDLTIIAAALRGAVAHDETISHQRLLQLHRRLVHTFTAELSSFERKQYVTLSAEPNKAMNLNSYIGLMGGRYREEHTSAGTLLIAVGDGSYDFEVPNTDYVLTLDADSVLLPEYCLRLLHVMEQPENQDVAVAQTPYSSFPGASTRIERVAGATTDIQHLVHQGMAEHNAGFWVGANAILRKTALDDLREYDSSDGRLVQRFISDRTVIEDTESTLDLAIKRWRIVNYPERLSYSATPPDFGSLCVQRQRWSNGGLIILRRLRTLHRAQKDQRFRPRTIEFLLRLNYLASIAWSTLALALLLAYPYSGELMSGLTILMAAPYFFVMATDLRRCGYKHLDVLRIYGFNMMLMPVNASGVLKSLGQAITGQKIAFARTPKIKNRTAAAAPYVLAPVFIVVLSAVTLWRDIDNQQWAHAVFAGANALITSYAILAFIGIRNLITDVCVAFVNRLYKPVRERPKEVALDPTIDWATVLYHGSVERPVRSGTRPAAAPATPLTIIDVRNPASHEVTS